MSGLQTQSRQIGEFTYTYTQLPARKGAEGLRRLGARISPLVASLAKEVGVGGLEASMPAVIGGLAGIVTSLSEEDLSFFLALFSDSATVEISPGKSPKVGAILDLHFAGKYEELLEFLIGGFTVNYQNFFTAALAKLGAALGAALSEQTPATNA